MAKLDIVCTMFLLIIFKALIISSVPIDASPNTTPAKFTLKTIKVDGDIVDCVDIYKQPAFDHPLLRDHKIQMRPSFYPEEREEERTATRSNVAGQTKEVCPNGTIPIIRSDKTYQKRRGLFSAKTHNLTRVQPTYDNPQQDHEYASAIIRGRFFGVKGSLNLWQPFVEGVDEFSLTQLWVVSESGGVNTLEAGWMVYPQKFKDTRVRLFIYWTADNYQNTGCYNLECSGFVHIGDTVLGGPVNIPISTYGGAQHYLNLSIFRDDQNPLWWLEIDGKAIGYWPASIVPGLKDLTGEVQFGGEVVNSKAGGKHSATQMGSGHFPAEGFSKASFVGDVKTYDGSRKLIAPPPPLLYRSRKECYDINIQDGKYFYGGPGRSATCT